MRLTKRIFVLFLSIALVLTMPVLAFAKTSSSPIDAPEGNTSVFSIIAGDRSMDFTWDEISGKGAYASFTDTYAAKVDGESTTQEWTGVKAGRLVGCCGKTDGRKLLF